MEQPEKTKKKGLLRRLWSKPFGKVFLFFVFVLFLAVFTYGSVELTSIPSFCDLCHEIKPTVESWKRSEHYIFDGKMRATCRDCHIPYWNTPVDVMQVKITYGFKDLYYHFANADKFSNPEWRYGVKSVAEKYVTDQVCLRCHADVLNPEKDVLKADPTIKGLHTSEEAKKLACVVCHKNTGHDTCR